MNTYSTNKNNIQTNEAIQKKSVSEATSQFIDNRPEAIIQRKLQTMATNSSRFPINNKLTAQRKQTSYLQSNLYSPEVIQLFVKKRTSETGWKYFSSFDPDKLFDNQEDAFIHDQKLLNSLPVPHQGESQADRTNRMIGTRYPTLYTYMTSGSNTIVENRDQGPHSVSHVHVAQALSQINTYNGLIDFFHHEIPTPENCQKMIETELGKSLAGDMQYRYEKFIADYASLYSQIIHLIGGRDDVPLELLRESISRIIEMNPYTTYSWRSGKKAGRKAIKGKGENRGVDFDSSIDQKGKWKSQENYNQFVDGRRMLHRGDYAHPEEYDGPEDSGYDSINEVIEDAMIEEIKVGDKIFLNPIGQLVVSAIYLETDSNGSIIGARVQLHPIGG